MRDAKSGSSLNRPQPSNAFADAKNPLDAAAKGFKQTADAVAKGATPKFNPDGTISVTPPGTVTFTVDPKNGGRKAEAFGMCVGISW
jgi:hypothetical protein